MSLNVPVKISILGCGWLGLPLAKSLILKGYSVKGSTTHEDKMQTLKDAKINPFLISFNPNAVADKLPLFFESDILIINFPPKLRTKEGSFYLEQIDLILTNLRNSRIKKIVFVSSTSVYPDSNRELMESEVENITQAENKILFTAEQKIMVNISTKYLILRCGGLTGYDRMLIKHFAGKKALVGGNSPVNLIHRDDVVGIILNLLEKDIWNTTLNICAPQHPARTVFYKNMAEKYGYELPEFALDDNEPYKIISIDKLEAFTDYKFTYPNPLEFIYL